MKNERPIGIFDSGMGGISVLALASIILVNENFIYYGDNKYAPYGVKTSEEVLNRSSLIVKELLSLDCKAILIACNTATSVAAKSLREEYNIPIIAMEPALKPAATQSPNKTVLVLATDMTLRLDKFKVLMSKYGDNAVPIPCPELVDFVENFEPNIDIVKKYLISKFFDFDLNNVGSVVLGCTHFIFIKNLLREILPNHIKIIDGNLGTVLELKRRLESNSLINKSKKNGKIKIVSSSEDVNLICKMNKLMNIAKSNKDYFDTLNI